MGLIGPNGSGKSTFLKLAAKVMGTTAGSVTTSGRLVAIFDLGLGVHPDYTGRENLELAASLAGLPEGALDAERQEAIIAFSGLGDAIDRPVKHYSTGMKARFGFAVAAFCEPDVLLIDELLAVGDHEFRTRVIEQIRQLVYDGAAPDLRLPQPHAGLGDVRSGRPPGAGRGGR